MTLATDYALAAANGYFGMRLLGGTSPARRCWGAGFVALGASALLGGTYHGFGAVLGARALAALWQITAWAIGAGCFLLLLGIARAGLPSGPRRWLVALATALFLAYAALSTRSQDYLLQVAYTGVTMLFILVVSLLRLRVGGRFALWMVAGVAVSAVAAGVQAAGLAPHRRFNHNDLYHVIQMLGMYLFFRGGMLWGLPPPASRGER
jgi:hypothetical protein